MNSQLHIKSNSSNGSPKKKSQNTKKEITKYYEMNRTSNWADFHTNQTGNFQTISREWKNQTPESGGKKKNETEHGESPLEQSKPWTEWTFFSSLRSSKEKGKGARQNKSPRYGCLIYKFGNYKNNLSDFNELCNGGQDVERQFRHLDLITFPHFKDWHVAGKRHAGIFGTPQVNRHVTK